MTRKSLSNTLAVLGFAIALAASFGGTLLYGQTMTVYIQGLRSADGVVHVLVYDNATAFDETSLTDLVSYSTQRATTEILSIELNGIRPGKYA